ncbi:MAG: saccharopine dehydrogenase family protein [Alphaproteobacteria bacterium]
MKQVMIVGAGKIGEAVARLLLSSGDYAITLVDSRQEALDRVAGAPDLGKQAVDAGDSRALAEAMAGHFAVISAAPFDLTTSIADAARIAGIHYLDLTEDVASTRHVKALAEGADRAFIPQCGLAPGFISIVGYDLAKRFDSLDSLHLRVGALPQYPSNALSYNLTWSTEGVINEYCEPCEAIVDGKRVAVPPLEEIERFALDGITYEAFNTSGGLGTLCDTLEGRVRQLNYRSIRYPGHRDFMKGLIQDLRLGSRRELLREVLEHAVPATMQDVIVIFATATGTRDGRLMQETYANKVYARQENGVWQGGIQITTSAGVAAVLDMLKDGVIRDKGFVKQEEIALDDFLANRFGRAFAQASRQGAGTSGRGMAA